MRLFLLFCFIGLSLFAQNGIVAPDAQLAMLADGFQFTEGPASDAAGNVYFTDQPNDRIMLWSVDDELSTFMQPSGRANGLCFDDEGHLWACADAENQLWRIDMEKNVTILVDSYHDSLLNGPNDVWVTPDGGAFFTDPYYKRPYWQREQDKLDVQGVYYLSPDHKTLTRVIDDLLQPNGIIGTPDGKTLYVTDIRAGKTYSYSISNDKVSDKTLFCEMGSDGMTLDNHGNVYLTGEGVTVFDSTGAKIEHIAVPEPWTANVCFGGSDKQTLFITASTKVYGLKMSVKGVGSQ